MNTESSTSGNLKRYEIKAAESWMESPTDEELLNISKESTEVLDVSLKEYGICQLRKNTILTTNEANKEYSFSMYELSNPNLLQHASTHEISVRESDHVLLHRISVIRDGILTHKAGEVLIRVFSDEKESGRGSINKLQKMHIVIGDLRLGDTIIFEYTIVREFGSEFSLDTRYYYRIQDFTNGYWIYNTYQFKLLTERDEPLTIRKRYFRDEKGELLPESPETLQKGTSYIFAEKNFRPEAKKNVYDPYIEIATIATWEEISSVISEKTTAQLSELTEADRDILNDLIKDSATLEDKARRCIEYVQNEIVYLYDADSMHGHVPQSVSVTLMNRSGDCKAKSLLLAAFLHEIGLEAVCVLVNYTNDRFIPEQLPSPFIFNHEIVRFVPDGKTYFVDPTWSNRLGSIPNRAEPSFGNYLPILPQATLTTRAELTSLAVHTEENAEVKIKGMNVNVSISATFKKESADRIRARFKRMGEEDLLTQENELLRTTLIYNNKQLWETILTNPKYVLVSDDTDENVLVTYYTAELRNFFKDNQKVLRYYYPWSNDGIDTYDHKDREFDPLFTRSFKYILSIESSSLIDRRVAVTKKECVIDNSYFRFSNLKSIGFLKATITSEYVGKSSDYIKKEDLDHMKKVYAQISDNNLGVGIVFLSPFRAAYRYGYILLLTLYVLGFIVVPLLRQIGN